MLQWHDGTNWEHRAYWGEDKIAYGQPGTPSRRPIGPLASGRPVGPPGGARRPGGPGGQGSPRDGLRPVRGPEPLAPGGGGAAEPRREKELVVATTFPMRVGRAGPVVGPIPPGPRHALPRRAAQRAGEPEQADDPAKAVAIPDNPPQVVLERPGADLVLSEPGKVPLAIAAFDDFGLADVVVAVQKGDSGGFIGRPVRRYETPAAQREPGDEPRPGRAGREARRAPPLPGRGPRPQGPERADAGVRHPHRRRPRTPPTGRWPTSRRARTPSARTSPS